MIKFLLFSIIFALFSATTLNAAIYKGQRIFVKRCLECHKEGQGFITKYKADEWNSFFKENGKPLAKIHLSNRKAKGSWKFFQNANYAKKSKHLKQFLMEYAKDSGNVPACN